MAKLNGQSFDVVEDNISKLKEIFPEIVNGDNQIDFDNLRDILEKDIEVVDDTEEHYKFTWWGKKESKRKALGSTTKTLRPSVKDSKFWKETENIYIEGDNLDALKILLGSYRNRIKMIYIDPPYNTGHDFVYKDDRTETKKEHIESTGQTSEEGFLYENAKIDGKYHSNWLNMMYPRLYLSKKLLTDDGVIFISIDDNEVANLKKICDEIFGESNFISILKWKKKKQPSFLSKVAGVIEYILVYAKHYDNVPKLFGDKLADNDKPIINASNNVSEKYFNAGVQVRSITDGVIHKGIYKNRSMSIEYLDDIIVKNGLTQNKFRAKAKFRSTQDNINQNVKDNLVFITSNNGLRRLLTEEEKAKRKSITDLILDWGQNQDGSSELKNIFEIDSEVSIFDNPKPVELIKNLIDTNSHEDSIILDYFSGSGTLAHSVMKLNAEENFNIKYILVQLDEETKEGSEALNRGYKYISEIGKERIRRAGDKILEESDNKDLDIGFKVFKIDESNFIPWNPTIKTPEEARQAILDTANNLVRNRSELDLVYELILQLNLDLNAEIEEKQINNHKFYVVNNGFLLICLDPNIDESIAKDIINLREELMTEYCKVILLDKAMNALSSINIFNDLDSEDIELDTI